LQRALQTVFDEDAPGALDGGRSNVNGFGDAFVTKRSARSILIGFT